MKKTKKQEPPKEPERIIIYCAVCGSTNVQRDASASWSIDTQAWELCATYDAAVCESCGGETTLREAPIKGREER